MSWVRLDDGFHDHPRTLGVSAESLGIYMLALTYSARHRTDGRLSKAAVEHLVSTRRVGDINQRTAELVGAGLWEEDGGSYVIHDYLDYNPSAKSLEEQRKAQRERMQNLRESRAQDVRAHILARADVCLGDGTGRESSSDSSSLPLGGGEGEGALELQESAHAREKRLREGWKRFWIAYPKRKNEAEARAAWNALAPSPELVEEILAAIAAQKKGVDWRKLGGDYIPTPANWLTRGCWTDDVRPDQPKLETKKTAGNVAVIERFIARHGRSS